MKRTIKALLFVTVFAAGGLFAQEEADAQIPVIVNVAANVTIVPPSVGRGTGAQGAVTANTQRPFDIKLVGRELNSTSISHRSQAKAGSGAQISHSRGNVTLNLQAPQYQNAVISLHSVNGRQVLNSRLSASGGTHSISRSNIPAGVYLLSVKGTNGNTFTTKITHGGSRLNINVAFSGAANPLLRAMAAEWDYGEWTITVEAAGHITYSRKFTPVAGANPPQEFTMTPVTQTALANFTETVTVNGVTASFNMVFIQGGTFRLGCEGSGCPANTGTVDATVSPYFIGAATVTTALWNAVMGTSSSGGFGGGGPTSGTWYDAHEFACKLSQLTGRNYRMMTEAEFEYAAKNHLGSLTLGSTEEWAYNTWNATHTGGTDPVGVRSGAHDQKTRRNAQGTGDNITGRLIRSIEGIGPTLRLTLSATMDLPPDYVHPCQLYAPTMGAEPVNSYRDMRWITGSDARWIGGMGMPTEFRLWEDGTATMTTNFGTARVINGQWFTSNNITLMFVPTPGQGGFGPAPTITRYAYIFLNETDASFISTAGGAGRLVKEAATGVTKPVIAGLMTGRELARSMDDYETDFKMIDMVNIPQSARGQDERLFDGPDHGWLQINRGSAHHYRKDVDADEFRFVVSGAMLANGEWFTVNNSFLRIINRITCPWNVNPPDTRCNYDAAPYVTDYLYVVTSSGVFMHNSFMGYERGDFRSFTRLSNDHADIAAIANQCSRCVGEIPKGQAGSFYRTSDNGQSTFVPAPCPAGGC
ncbi:MAG: SUMF1/EgtB/PvdO family nonheme iron enzyme [Chitinispirillales bacterium]|nr:SUMF1/EgtB/PvdO family nonheme iron enzyme [Chitinispirillales bacterium]